MVLLQEHSLVTSTSTGLKNTLKKGRAKFSDLLISGSIKGQIMFIFFIQTIDFIYS